MPRKETELNPADGPLPAFACRLRAQREAAGLTYREIAVRAHYSHAAFVKAAGGSTMPTWDVTSAFLIACGIDRDALDDWRQLWQNTKTAVNAPSLQPAAAATTHLSPQPDVPDAAGQAPERIQPVLAPDISKINGPGDFVQLLRALKNSIGEPSIRELSRRSGIPRSTLGDLLNPHRQRLDWRVVRRYLDACGINESELGLWFAAFAHVTSVVETPTLHRSAEVSAAPETLPPTTIPSGTSSATIRRRPRLMMTATMITIIIVLVAIAIVILR